MSNTYQRYFVNGFEKTNNTYATINPYNAIQISINGADRIVHELLLYNYDMVGYDFEKSAANQQTYLVRKN